MERVLYQYLVPSNDPDVTRRLYLCHAARRHAKGGRSFSAPRIKNTDCLMETRQKRENHTSQASRHHVGIETKYLRPRFVFL